MEVTRYQFSRSANSSEERVLAHYSEVSLLLENRADLPEELQGAKKGMLYLTQYKMIFQHKSKGSTIIRFPLQLLGECVLEEEPDSKQQHIKGILTSIQGVIVFKFTFQYGAADCLNMIKDLSEAERTPTSRNIPLLLSTLTPIPQRPGQLVLSTCCHCGHPLTPAHQTFPHPILKWKKQPHEGAEFQTSKRVVATAEDRESRVKETGRTEEQKWKDAVKIGIVYACALLKRKEFSDL